MAHSHSVETAYRVETAKRKAVEFLNAHFDPWTFDGTEPVSEALASLLLGGVDSISSDYDEHVRYVRATESLKR